MTSDLKVLAGLNPVVRTNNLVLRSDSSALAFPALVGAVRAFYLRPLNTITCSTTQAITYKIIAVWLYNNIARAVVLRSQNSSHSIISYTGSGIFAVPSSTNFTIYGGSSSSTTPGIFPANQYELTYVSW